MKKPYIVLLQHGRNLSGFDLARLRPALELMSCRAEVCICRDTKQLIPVLAKNPPDLVILDHPLLHAGSLLSERGLNGEGTLNFPRIVLSEEKGLLRSAVGKAEPLEFPVELIALHGLIAKCLFHYPRKHLRMPVHLPCIFSARGLYSFGEILSLGTGGAFIKTPCHHVRTGDLVDVGIPLVGMKIELEMRSRVIYSLTPKSENNYLQGLGVGFVTPGPETTRVLEDFIRLCLLDEISPDFQRFGLPAARAAAPNGSADSLTAVNSRLQFRS